jgi:hypothetical protein
VCLYSLKTSGDDKLEFHFVASASSSQISSTHSIFLTNIYDYSLHFSITLSQPFFIAKNLIRSSTDSMAPVLFSCDSLSGITLPPSHMLMLEIRFAPSEEMLRRFEDYEITGNLLISFLNGFHQVENFHLTYLYACCQCQVSSCRHSCC